MIVLGLLLVLGAAGLGATLLATNQDTLAGTAGTVELLGYHADPTAGQLFLAGTATGAATLLGVFLLATGTARRARRRGELRRRLRTQEKELRDLRRTDTPAPDEVTTH